MSRAKAASKKSPKTLGTPPKAKQRAEKFSAAPVKLAQAPTPPAAIVSAGEQPIQRVDFDVNSIMSYPELLAALDAKKVQITLGNNIIATDNIVINYDVAINFNGFSIISEEQHQAARVLDIRSGEVTLTGRGKIFAMGARSVAIRVFGAISTGVPNYTHLTIDEGISLLAPDSYGILISPNLGVAYGLTVDFAGRILAHDGICLASGVHGHEENLPLIKIKSGARITADDVAGVAIEAAGYGKWEITTAKLHGACGVSLRSGILQFNNTQIWANHDAAFRITDSVDHDLEVTIDGGTYLAEASEVITGVAETVKNFVIKNGDFCSYEDVMAEDLQDVIMVEGGDFQTKVTEMLAEITPSFSEQEQAVSVVTSPAAKLPQPEPATTVPAIAELVDKADILPELSKKEDVLTELTDDATDEREIILELTAEKVAPPDPVKIAAPAPLQPVSDQDAARMALADAITDIRKLSAEDYDVGFGDLEQAIRAAERVLIDPLAELNDICAAASKLLQAFDGLEERGEMSLSDEELDELFYHGAVLEEMAQPTHRKKSKATPSIKNARSVIPEAPQPVVAAAEKPTEEPDFTVLSDILDVLSEIDLQKYTSKTRMALLDGLDRAQEILRDENSSQSMIDELATNLLAEMSKLELIPHTHAPAMATAQPKTLAPVVAAVPATMIDEMSPTVMWSQGVTMIDELAPFITDATTRQKMLRAMQPWIVGMAELATEPLRNLIKSIKAGTRAGINAYRETLQASKSS